MSATPRSHISRWLVELLRPIHFLFTRLYFRVEIQHPESIPRRGPVILAPTHRSRWDTILLYRATNRLLRFLTSHDEFIGFQGWVMNHMGAFPVNTRRPAPSALKHCLELLRTGQALVIFPEATIFYYPPNNVHPIKSGAAWMALECQRREPSMDLQIVPIRLIYEHPILRFRDHAKVEVRPAIEVRSYLNMPEREGIKALTRDLQAALGDVVNESMAEMSTPRTPPPEQENSPG